MRIARSSQQRSAKGSALKSTAAARPSIIDPVPDARLARALCCHRLPAGQEQGSHSFAAATEAKLATLETSPATRKVANWFPFRSAAHSR